MRSNLGGNGFKCDHGKKISQFKVAESIEWDCMGVESGL